MAKFTKPRYTQAWPLLGLLLSLPVQAGNSAEQAVRQHAVQLIQQRLSDAGLGQADIRLQLLPPRDLPACVQAWRVEATDSRAFSRMRFSVGCPDKDWSGDYIVRASVNARVASAARDLPAGAPLQKEDIAWSQRPVSEPADLFGASSPPLGLAARAALSQGQLLRRKQLQAPLLVKRGGEVRIVARQDGIEVSNAGEALANGRKGEVIRVRNVASGKVISARVGADGEVEAMD
ncbi:flagellar basal body P-ring formation chaperone FlgA [Chromobacterium sphagni]|uniref:Flagella basal body P-ring formation protein FlgA n=1 Tax=Chromobacterium sphagni TaxID=1903179 RepID=A0A1S1X4Z3_9NEIS|nr:flagellar basal body P-ring formation chaperone FlgA [Chromobacterium sphagni]OHX14505.1 flagella basal body P-ring formation protein FlgA [Chromobacterium sphagni]OHX20585.1 flagella basal body P-ring formation protein FlgA [Chromobacterium sphagni]